MKKLLLLIALFWGMACYADEMYLPELTNLFEADLVIDASFKSQSKTHFYIIVNETIKGGHYEIKKGDQIKLFRDHDGCGFTVNYSNFKRNRYYLKKGPKGWRLNYGSIQSIKSLYQFGAIKMNDSQCGLSHVAIPGRTKETMSGLIREFVKTYQLDRSKNEYVPMVDSLTLFNLSNKNKMIAAFEKRGRCCLSEDIELVEEPEPETAPEELPLMACSLFPQKAISPYEGEEMRTFLLENDNPLSEMGIEGKVYVKLFIDEQGAVNDVELLKGIHPILDTLALNKASNMHPWKPAVDNVGRLRKCFTNLPFKFTLKSKE